MTRISICAYPWDLVGDESAGDRLASSGADSVVIAAAYHSVRAATPQHPAHRVMDAATAAFYLPVRASAWRGSRLVPRTAESWAGPSSFTRAAASARAAGLSVEAWLVLTHSSAVGSRVPELCVTNAFGDVYDYALCPNNQDVVEYAITLVAETAEQAGVDALVVEAIGPLGLSHLGHHEKTAGAGWSTTDEALLSLCFCARCRSSYADLGLDPDEFATAVRRTIGTGCTSPIDALGERAAVALTVRAGAVTKLKRAVTITSRERGIGRVSFHAQPDPWAVGPAAASMSGDDDAYLLPASVLVGLDAAHFNDIRVLAGRASLGAYVSAMPPSRPASLAAEWSALVELGVDELCVYHFGLLSVQRLSAVADAISIVAGRQI